MEYLCWQNVLCFMPSTAQLVKNMTWTVKFVTIKNLKDNQSPVWKISVIITVLEKIIIGFILCTVSTGTDPVTDPRIGCKSRRVGRKSAGKW